MVTVKDEVLMVLLVLGLEVIMNQIGIDDEGILGYYAGSFDSMTYEKKLWVIFQNVLRKKADAEMVGSGCGP